MTCFNLRANALVVSKEIQITNDGVIDTVFNGIPDHAYELSVLLANYAHYINPSGTSIAFAQINDTLVTKFLYTIYGHPEDLHSRKYPCYK